ncbi:MAG: hypothetical protein ACOYMY_08150 [Prochlorococcaceae cyanobacterium]
MLLRPLVGLVLLLTLDAVVAFPLRGARNEERPLAAAEDGELWQRLRSSDALWLPRVEVRDDGRRIYRLRRLAGDPPLDLMAMQALERATDPFAAERRQVHELVDTLRHHGVLLRLGPPRRRGALAEWEPRARVLRLRHDALDQGHRGLARILNHEAIHVAQSCAAGGLRRSPQLLGIPRALPPELESVLASDTYALLDDGGRELEREAFAGQGTPGLGARLIRRHCRPAAPAAPPPAAG